MLIQEKIYKVIEEKNLKQSSLAEAAGYGTRKFNDMLRGRKKIEANDIIPICKVLGITPNELLEFDQKGTA